MATTISTFGDGYRSLLTADSLRACYAQPENVEALAAVISGELTRRRIKVVSLDVFDTALLRHRSSEAGRFWEVSERFVREYPKAGSRKLRTVDLFMARVFAARSAYAIAPVRSGNKEGTFTAISGVACLTAGIPGYIDQYRQNEVDYESSTLVPNPLVQALAARLPDTRFIYISDMYLESGRIADIIKRVCMVRAVSVYSSADGCGSKSNGQLFSHVCKDLGLAPDEIAHLGDNLHSDFVMPRKAGMHSIHLPVPEAEKQARLVNHSLVSKALDEYGMVLGDYLNFNM